MARPNSTWLCLLIVLGLEGVFAQRSYSSCATANYRRLSNKLQNEHHCMLMEQIQNELLKDEEGGIRRYRDTLSILGQLDYKLDQVLYTMDDQYANFGDEWLQRIKDKIDEERARIAKADQETCAQLTDVFMPNEDGSPVLQDCEEILQHQGNISGVYPLKMPNNHTILAYCDQQTDGGGWTVIQRRINGAVHFFRNWTAYKNGFGNVNSEYWLGNEYLHLMTHNKDYSLRVDLWDWENATAYAEYSGFRIGDEGHKYILTSTGYNGNAGDALNYHHNSPFSTPDRDNDPWFGSCAKRDRAGWWYRDCSFASLNSQYQDRNDPNRPKKMLDGILWYHWHKDYDYSMKAAEMKIRPFNWN